MQQIQSSYHLGLWHCQYGSVDFNISDVSVFKVINKWVFLVN